MINEIAGRLNVLTLHTMNRKRIARIAGLWYLLVIITGMVGMAWVPARLIDADSAANTLHNIAAQESFFRMGIASSAICFLSFIALPFALYHLLQPVQERFALLMVLLALLSVPISLYSLTNKFAILELVHAVQNGTLQETATVYERLTSLQQLYDSGIAIAGIFWGLWLLPFGYLVVRSGFLPRIMGMLLIGGGSVYLLNFFGNILFAGYAASGIGGKLRLLPALAEIGTCSWLLIAGAKNNIQNINNSTDAIQAA